MKNINLKHQLKNIVTFLKGFIQKTNKMVTDEEVKKGDYGFLNAMKMAFSESIAVPRVVNNFILNKLLTVFKQSNKITNPNEST